MHSSPVKNVRSVELKIYENVLNETFRPCSYVFIVDDDEEEEENNDDDDDDSVRYKMSLVDKKACVYKPDGTADLSSRQHTDR